MATTLLCAGLNGCEDTDVNINVNSNQETDQPTTEPTTQPEESTTGGGTIPEPPGPDSGIVERDPTQSANPTDPPKEELDPPEEETPVEPPKVEEMTYKKYEALSEDEKMAFQSTFASRREFLNWYKAAKKAYEDSQQHVTIGPGDGLNIGDYIK